MSTIRKRLFNSDASHNNNDADAVPIEKVKNPRNINIDYGENAEQPEEDIEIVQAECSRLLETLKVSFV